jgi:hypothetical protein
MTTVNHVQELSISYEKGQYKLWEILGIWAGAALPMGLIYWVILPILNSRGNMYPFMYLLLITSGMVWQGVLAYIILRREVRPFTWEGVKARLWLFTPSDPRTGVRSKTLFLWMLPLVVVSQAYFRIEVMDWLNELLVKTFPVLTPPPYTLMRNLAGPAVGQWWLLGVLAVMIVFNYLLGEELIFRGILLPKMNGVFGKWDWLANHILFITYHLHKISDWPALLFMDWIMPWTTKWFKSYWVAVILHGVESIMLIYMFPLAIMGLV